MSDQRTDAEFVDDALEGTLAPVAAEVRAAILPSVRLLRTADGGPAVGRMGGLPRVAEGIEWPRFQQRPLGFMAEIDLAALPPLRPGRDLLPAGGSLSFFLDVDPEHQPWGFDPADRGSGQVLFTPAGVERVSLDVPTDLSDENLYEEGELAARVELTLPSAESLAAPDLPIRSELREAYFDLLDALAARQGDDDMTPRHRLLGHPEEVQGEMQTEVQLVSNGLYVGDSTGYDDPRAEALRAGATQWRLLLQLDSEFGGREVMWGDAGRIYFWGHERDMSRGDFSAVWTILQCG